MIKSIAVIFFLSTGKGYSGYKKFSPSLFFPIFGPLSKWAIAHLSSQVQALPHKIWERKPVVFSASALCLRLVQK